MEAILARSSRSHTPTPTTTQRQTHNHNHTTTIRHAFFEEKDRQLAKRLLADGKTDRAKLLLRKKKYQVIVSACVYQFD